MTNSNHRSPLNDRLTSFAGRRFLSLLEPLLAAYSRAHRMSLKTRMALVVTDG